MCIKSKFITIFQIIRILLFLPSILLIKSCSGAGAINVVPSNNPILKESKQEVQNISTTNEIIIFCGNPGVGKSLLLNSILDKNQFKSGSRFGEGLTKNTQEYYDEIGQRNYIDTPGLSDIESSKKIAELIEQALKKNNKYKVIFVMTLESGSLREDDINTINKICDSISTPSLKFGIIVNKVEKKVIDLIDSQGGIKTLLTPYAKHLNKHKELLDGENIIIIQRDPELDNKDLPFLNSSEERAKLVKFIDRIEANYIKSEEVKPIDTTNYKEEYIRLENDLNRTKKDLDAKKEELDRTKKDLDGKQEELGVSSRLRLASA